MKPSKWIAATAALLLTASCLIARADDPKPAVFGRASVSSFDDAKKLIADLGIPFPGDPTKMIEGMFPFIGPGGLQTDKPAGVIFVAGENTGVQQLEIIALPLVAAAAGIPDLTKMGGQAVAGHPDILSMPGNMSFRRSPNYIMFYAGAVDILGSAADDPFAKDYTRPGRLALVTVDLAAARAAAPTPYKAFTDSMNSPPSPGANPAASKAGADMVKNFVDNLEHLSLALSRDDQNVHIETWMRPFDVKGSRKFPQPTFPADTIAQINVAYPNADMADWLARSLDTIPVDGFTDAHTNADQAAKLKPLFIKLVHLVSDADAQSFAISMKAGKPVIYVVNQYGSDVDLAKELPPLAADLNAANKDTGDGDLLAISTYQNGAGKSVTRVTIMDKGQPKGNIDLIQDGRVATFAIGSDDGKYLDAVVGLPTKGEMANLCTGSIDLGAALKAAQASGQGPPLPPAMLAEITTAFNGQSITWTAKTIEQTKDVYVDLGLPIPVLKEVGKIASGIMASMGGGPGGPPGGPAGPPPGESPAPGATPAPAPMPNP